MFGNVSDNPAAPPVRWKPPVFGVSAVLLIGLLWGISGCGRSSSGPGGGGPPAPPPDEALRKTALDMMQPDRLGIDAKASRVAGLLNQWRAIKLKTNEQERLSQPLTEKTRAYLKQFFSDETLKQIEQDSFVPEDAEHIRTGFLTKEIALRVTKGVEGQLNQAQVLFDYINRNVQLVDEDDALPAMPYEVLALGEGTAEDRAWVFAELLRQLNLDAVIVKPKSEAPAMWFVGVIAEKELRLFDAQRATPVPAGPRGDRTDILPATPSDLSNPDVLKSLTGDSADPLPPQTFDKLQIELIGTPTLWAPRLAALEKRLTGKDAAVIYQELTGPPNDPSAVLNRIAGLKEKRWESKDIRPWSHSETRFQAHRDSDELQERWKPFLVPYKLVLDQQNRELTASDPSYRMLLTRTLQLQGLYKEAITGYLQVQLGQKNVPSQLSADIRAAYADAADDAFFWTGVCQMEQETLQPAVDKFSVYIQRAETFSGIRHADLARVLMARCLGQLGRPADAIQALESLNASSPEYAEAEFLKRELAATTRQAPPEKPKSQPAETTKPKPEQTPEPHSKEPEAEFSKPAIAEKPAS